MNVPPLVRAPRVQRALGGLVAWLVLALVLAASAAAASTDTTATATEPTTATVTVTEQQTTTVQTTVQSTVQQTVTHHVTTTTAPAATTSSSTSSFPTWAIVLIVVGGIGLVAAVAFLLGRGRKSADSAVDGRRRILDAAVASAVASGWTVESTSGLGAVIRHNGDRAMLTVDEHGQIIRRPLEGGEPTP